MCWSRCRRARMAIRSLPSCGEASRRRKTSARRSSICRRSAFMAITAAPGSTNKRRSSRMSARSRERLAAEQAWQDFGARRGIAVAILRLAGIYGPGQNALVQIARGKARRIVKPGQIFNRIHVGDIAQAIDAAFRARSIRNFQCRRRRADAARRSDRFCGAALGTRAAAGNRFRRRRAVDVADGVEFLAGLPAREERQAQARAWRRACAIRLIARDCGLFEEK